ncbi:hypothetical protein ACWEP4_15400 [Streptomyces sp. NPDC004227]
MRGIGPLPATRLQQAQPAQAIQHQLQRRLFQAVLDQTGKSAERRLRQEHAHEVPELRSSLDVLAQHIQLLTLENQRLSKAADQNDRVTRIDRR